MSTRAQRVTRWAASTLALLIALVLAWQLSRQFTVARAALAVMLVTPLLLPLRGLIRGNRRTYAWATLCVIPYFILGVTEAIANPPQRAWAAGCLSVALALFVLLILYLRLTRDVEEQ